MVSSFVYVLVYGSYDQLSCTYTTEVLTETMVILASKQCRWFDHQIGVTCSFLFIGFSPWPIMVYWKHGRHPDDLVVEGLKRANLLRGTIWLNHINVKCYVYYFLLLLVLYALSCMYWILHRSFLTLETCQTSRQRDCRVFETRANFSRGTVSSDANEC